MLENQSIKNDQFHNEQKAAVKRDALGLWKTTIQFVSNLLDFRNDTDKRRPLFQLLMIYLLEVRQHGY